MMSKRLYPSPRGIFLNVPEAYPKMCSTSSSLFTGNLIIFCTGITRLLSVSISLVRSSVNPDKSAGRFLSPNASNQTFIEASFAGPFVIGIPLKVNIDLFLLLKQNTIFRFNRAELRLAEMNIAVSSNPSSALFIYIVYVSNLEPYAKNRLFSACIHSLHKTQLQYLYIPIRMPYDPHLIF